MTWQTWQWTFELESPLHVGFHKVMHLYRTRPYVLGRNLWAALTARLTQLAGAADYSHIGQGIQQCARFGYLYPCQGDFALFPRLTEGGFVYGRASQSQREFERRHLCVFASTAIESSSFTAEEESLHEVEVLSPWLQGLQELDPPRRSSLSGLFWVKPEHDTFSDVRVRVDDRGVSIQIGRHSWPLGQAVEDLQIGGERRYGFGKMRLSGGLKRITEGVGLFPGRLDDGQGMEASPVVILEKGDAIWAHAELHGVTCKGDLEPVVGRDWHPSRGSGRQLTAGRLYWAPGSILEEEQAFFEVNPLGFWRPRSVQ